MIETKVRSIEDRSIAYFEKDGNGVLVCIKGTSCIIVSATHTVASGAPFIPYVYQHNDSSHAYEDFLHLMGKMVLKEPSSKYFGQPLYAEHCKNGRPQGVTTHAWEALAREFLEKYKACETMPSASKWRDNPPTGKELDEMSPEEVKAFVDSVDYQVLQPVLDSCSFACVKRTYEKYYGFRPVSTLTKDRVINQFWETKRDRHRADLLIGPCV